MINLKEFFGFGEAGRKNDSEEDSSSKAVRAQEPEEAVLAESEPEPEPEIASAPEPEPEIVAEPEPEPEPVVYAEPEPEPEPVVYAEPAPEPEPVVYAEPEPEPVVYAEPAPEPEPVVYAEPAPEPEPVVYAEPEPAEAPAEAEREPYVTVIGPDEGPVVSATPIYEEDTQSISEERPLPDWVSFEDIPREEEPAADSGYEDEAPRYATYDTHAAVYGADSSYRRADVDFGAPDQETYYQEVEPEPEPQKGFSIISFDAYVDGNISTMGDVEIQGSVNGDITAKGNVDVEGSVRGDVAGDKIGLYSCKVKGNLNAGTGIVQDPASIVVGNIATRNIILGGKLKGDIETAGLTALRSSAYYVGNLITGSIAVENGAVINGSVRTVIDGDPDEPFDMI
jgi:cytoskeletal protein CcmA (bactofilin family)